MNTWKIVEIELKLESNHIRIVNISLSINHWNKYGCKFQSNYTLLEFYPDLMEESTKLTLDILFVLRRCTVSSGTESAMLLVIEIRLRLLPKIFKFIISPILPPIKSLRRTLKYSTPSVLRFSCVLINASSTSEKLERRRHLRASCAATGAEASAVTASSAEVSFTVSTVCGRKIIDERDGNSASFNGTNHSIFNKFTSIHQVHSISKLVNIESISINTKENKNNCDTEQFPMTKQWTKTLVLLIEEIETFDWDWISRRNSHKLKKIGKNRKKTAIESRINLQIIFKNPWNNSKRFSNEFLVTDFCVKSTDWH